MQRIAGMTVMVKAEGVPEALYNRQRDRVVETIRAEMERQKAAMNAQMDSMRKEMAEEIAIERDRADWQQKGRSGLLSKELERVKANTARSTKPLKRAAKAIEGAWAMMWAIPFCWLGIGEGNGL